MRSDGYARELESGAYGLVERNVPMSRLTSFRIGGPADFLIEPTTEKELARCIRYLNAESIPYFLVGNGSNLLVRDGGIRGAVVHLGKYYSDSLVDGTRIRAQAGMQLSAVAKMSFRAGLSGMEELSGIPGSVGGAVMMNAGAYGREMKDVVLAVRVLTPEGEFLDLSAEEMQFSYRHSILQDRGWIASEVFFELRPGNPEEIAARYADFTQRRTSKQPLDKPSAGSVFKRPEGHYASALIDEAGLRGYRLGGAQVSEKHCGFIINAGKATAHDVLALIAHIQSVVQERFHVSLEPEVRIVGED